MTSCYVYRRRPCMGTTAFSHTWSWRWQVTLAQEKTEGDTGFLTCSNYPPLQQKIVSVGLHQDPGSRVQSRLKKHTSRPAGGSDSCLVIWMDPSHQSSGRDWCSNALEAEVRSLMEYSPFMWSACPPSYLLLDKGQQRKEASYTATAGCHTSTTAAAAQS